MKKLILFIILILDKNINSDHFLWQGKKHPCQRTCREACELIMPGAGDDNACRDHCKEECHSHLKTPIPVWAK